MLAGGRRRGGFTHLLVHHVQLVAQRGPVVRAREQLRADGRHGLRSPHALRSRQPQVLATPAERAAARALPGLEQLGLEGVHAPRVHARHGASLLPPTPPPTPALLPPRLRERPPAPPRAVARQQARARARAPERTALILT